MTTKTLAREEKAHQNNISATEADGVRCEIDGVWVHSIPAYLARVHPDVSVEDYQTRYPDAELFSPKLQAARKRREGEVRMHSATVVPLEPRTPGAGGVTIKKKAFAEVFGLGDAPAAMNKRGEPIMIDVVTSVDPEVASFVPDVDDKYIFNIDLLKTVMMAVQMNTPLLLWGYHGTGKSTLPEQYCAHTGRPLMRVQHTINTEEAHIVGQYIVVGQETVFNPGPLAFAMRYGLVYLADEYDFALPSVTSVYQPVLEGKPLVIKEATPEWRVVKPHPNFRFIATGNTNGGGDESGLYQGTQMQNAANYSRFGITIEVPYMDAELEKSIVASQAGIFLEDADDLVKFGNMVRNSFKRGDISVTVSPRELIRAGIIGRALGGGSGWRKGLELAFANRLNSTDREVVNEMLGRIFGSASAGE